MIPRLRRWGGAWRLGQLPFWFKVFAFKSDNNHALAIVAEPNGVWVDVARYSVGLNWGSIRRPF